MDSATAFARLDGVTIEGLGLRDCLRVGRTTKSLRQRFCQAPGHSRLFATAVGSGHIDEGPPAARKGWMAKGC